jgi:hypothetical protein
MTWSRLVDFYLDKRKEIEELIELEDRAKKSLPELVAKFLRDSIRQDIANWNGFPDPVCDVDSERGEHFVWWADKSFYDVREDTGPCFDIYMTANALLQPEDQDRPVLYLQFDGKSVAKRKAFLTAVSRIKSKQYVIGSPWIDSNVSLVYRPLANVLTLASLVDRDKLSADIRHIAKEFSEAMAPLCATLR